MRLALSSNIWYCRFHGSGSHHGLFRWLDLLWWLWCANIWWTQGVPIQAVWITAVHDTYFTYCVPEISHTMCWLPGIQWIRLWKHIQCHADSSGSRTCQSNVWHRDKAAADAICLETFPQTQTQQLHGSIWNDHTSIADFQTLGHSIYQLLEPHSISSSHSYSRMRSLESPLSRWHFATSISTLHQWLGSTNTRHKSPVPMAPMFDSPLFLPASSFPSQAGHLNSPTYSNSSTSISAHTLVNDSMSQECPGIALDWTVGSVHTTYPMHLHSLVSQTLGYYFSYMDPKGIVCWITSDDCTCWQLENGLACFCCQRLGPIMKTLHERALAIAPTTNNIYCNWIQLREQLEEKTIANWQLKLDVR